MIIRTSHDFDWRGGEALLRRAVKLTRGNPLVLHRGLHGLRAGAIRGGDQPVSAGSRAGPIERKELGQSRLSPFECRALRRGGGGVAQGSRDLAQGFSWMSSLAMTILDQGRPEK